MFDVLLQVSYDSSKCCVIELYSCEHEWKIITALGSWFSRGLIKDHRLKMFMTRRVTVFSLLRAYFFKSFEGAFE